MKSIIQGKRYDTDKAQLLGAVETDGLTKSDFRYWEAGLYKTPRSGSYFLAGTGHGMTPYGRSNAEGNRVWGQRIIPISPEDALKWAETYLDPTDVETAFANDIEDA